MSTSSDDWVRYYQQIIAVSGHGRAASNEQPNTVMGTATTINSSGGKTPGGLVTEPILKCQENHLFKPIRKRSRVSRQTPITLFSTTTTNFKAMVQQFTGYPYLKRAHINLGLENSQPIANPNTVMVGRAGYNLAEIEQQRQFKHQQYMLPGNISGSVDHEHAFLQELHSSIGPVMAASGVGLGMDDAFPPEPPFFTRT
ncbi:hypothetical protein DCAR_0625050 [Daucus carota subsp. sativus]|uniref:Uncharacterized protein n=1 Tax=Daucus carota subsp. sativus TaxID=79200 RepID=A0A164W763_DAUCS|nr:PREDICTED: uncharacterized protein LOC108226201 [Daucus carota subsp. sativus]WOH05631.1 hypothetical protein DCAR_0625050 [Daucus carota subsp. sativus]